MEHGKEFIKGAQIILALEQQFMALLGFNINDQSRLYLGGGVNEGFSLSDPSKITVNLSPLVLQRIENILEDEHQWHVLDDASKAGYTRASRRIT